MNYLLVLFLLVGQWTPHGALPVSISAGPSLSCSTTEFPDGGITSVNLTTTGTADWIQWNNVATVERKSTGGSQISSYSFVPTSFTPANAIATNLLLTSTWTDGTPDASGSVTTGVINARSATNQGFSYTCPASASAHVCKAYGQYHIGPAKLVAHLSDSSAADYTYNTVGASGNHVVTTSCSYQAASAGQTLTFTWTSNLSGSPGVVINGAAFQ